MSDDWRCHAAIGWALAVVSTQTFIKSKSKVKSFPEP